MNDMPIKIAKTYLSSRYGKLNMPNFVSSYFELKYEWSVWGSRFLDNWIWFWQQNSETMEKAFFLILMSSYAEISLWGPKKENVT
jgi:hypothetical protein